MKLHPVQIDKVERIKPIAFIYDKRVSGGMVQKFYPIFMKLICELGKLAKNIFQIRKTGLIDIRKSKISFYILIYVITFSKSEMVKFFQIGNCIWSPNLLLCQNFGIFK